MRLIAEQVKVLRENRAELLAKKEEIIDYYKQREVEGHEDFGTLLNVDFNDEVRISEHHRELAEIEELLCNAQYKYDIDTDKIDIGTSFDIDFGDGEIDNIVLVEKSTPGVSSFRFSSLESDLGKAVLGHRKGDEIVYKVQATGRVLKAKISDIETCKDKYVRFINSETIGKRTANSVKVNDIEKIITPSQAALLDEEYAKERGTNNKRKREIDNIRSNYKVVLPTSEDKIEVGSHVNLLLQNDDDVEELEFEFINHAVSTELNSHFVEEISHLGQSIKKI